MEQIGAAITFCTVKVYPLLEVTTKIRLEPIGTFFKLYILEKKHKKISHFPNYVKKMHFFDHLYIFFKYNLIFLV